jgi:epoxyqueuosine reductase
MYNYYNPTKQQDPSAPKLSMYAYGRDYHKVVKNKLKSLFNWLQEEVGDINGRYFVDSAPILERDWAKKSGLGWIGKNTLLISPQKGSYFFLAEIICDVEFIYDQPIKDYCGTCKRCITACPTDAISPEGYLLDSNKCISYLTIEHKEQISSEFQDQMENWMYGCDICQQVCPWNRFSTTHQENDFLPKEEVINKTKEDWKSLTENEFDILFNGSAVKRTKYKGLKRNIDFLK